MTYLNIGALRIFKTLDLDETAQAIKNKPGAIYGGMITNRATAVRWIKLFDALQSNVVVGTTIPVITWGIPGQTTDTVAAIIGAAGQNGIQFLTGISICCTTGFADNDTGAPGANDIICNLFWA